MEELGKFLNSILERIKDFFEVIDLSIIIAGTLGILIIYWWQFLNDFSFQITHLQEYSIFIHIIIAYCIGVVFFSTGRLLRRNILKEIFKPYSDELYLSKINSHQLNNDENISRYLPLNAINRKALREFIWSDIRQCGEYGSSKGFLNKYWSISVIFDSLLGCTFFLDVFFLDITLNIFGNYRILFSSKCLLSITIILIMSISFFIKYCFLTMASTYDRYQDDEILASYAALKRKREYDRNKSSANISKVENINIPESNPTSPLTDD